MRARKFTNQQLKDAVADNFSLADVLRDINLVPAGGNYQTVNRLIKSMSLDTSHFTGQGWNRGADYVHPTGPKPLPEVLIKGVRCSSSDLRKRLIKEGIKLHKCEGIGCGITVWLDRPTPLELDHIDGDHLNNELSNLRLLCPNCHALTPTYRRRKSGSSKYQHLKTLPKRIRNH